VHENASVEHLIAIDKQSSTPVWLKTMNLLHSRLSWGAILVGALALSRQGAPAQEWARFRGANGSGIGRLDKPPTAWTEKDYLWKAELPGSGFSSPVLWGEKLFVTAGDAKTGERMLVCLDAASGKTLWSQRTAAPPYHTHTRNSYATSTPAVDQRHIYCCWATPEQYVVLAYLHDGTPAWQSELGPYKSQHGYGTSPIVVGGLVIVANEQDGGGSLVALNAADGETVWTVSRHGKNATYSTPCIYQPEGRAAEVIFTNWQHGITSLDPATGKSNWELSCFEVDKNERAIASPIVAGDLILGTCGFVTAQKHLVAVLPPGAGGEPKEVWRMERSVSYMPTPIFLNGLLFCCSEQGIATCLRADSGQQVWQERLSGNFGGSPVIAGDKMYCTDNKGEVVVLSASERYELLARNPLGEETQSTPAIAGGRVYFRTVRHVMALGGSR
jgi:outer membrane protein assembly factor BamB